MSTRGTPAPLIYRPALYWEERARRFAAEGDGLAAVCSYGMPAFYNRLIHWSQRRALEPWLRVRRGARVLDIGCGVGRWSRLLAARGACVTGIDLSPTMIAEATRRAARAGLAARCHFRVEDSAALELGAQFELIVGVTVLQHILDRARLRAALERIVRHLSPGGRVLLLEAAPVRSSKRCDSTVFRARQRDEYLQLFRECGLSLAALTGVDPAPFRRWLLPHLPQLPRLLRVPALLAVTLLSAPLDLFGRTAVSRSWHAVFVLESNPPGVTCV